MSLKLSTSLLFIAFATASQAYAQEIDPTKTDPNNKVDQNSRLEQSNKGDQNGNLNGIYNKAPRVLNPQNSNNVANTNFTESNLLKNQALNHPLNQPLPLNEFQTFIQYSTGKKIPLFGSEFFQNIPSTFAPLQNTPVPSDYTLGAGDELVIRGWGSIEIDYRAVVDRNGLISVPSLGTINLAGVKVGDAEAVIKSAVARQYRDVSVSVSFGRLRAMTVYVVGQALKPGSYTVSGFSTLVTALMASGGPNVNGSMRNVQVKRQGKVVGSFDMYAFISQGDKSKDIKLQDGDTIFIPAAAGYVALLGKVNTPAIYELKSKTETVDSLLQLAGGLPVVADPRRVYIERIDPSKSQPRSVIEIELNKDGLSSVLKNGDLLTVSPVTADFENAVTLRGAVNLAKRVPFKAGMKVRDLIPNREALITRASIQRQNDVIKVQDEEDAKREDGASILSKIGNLIDDLNWDYAVIERINRDTMEVKLVPFNLGKAMEELGSADNLELQAGDSVVIFSQNDIQVPIAKRKVFVKIEGEVNVPGVYQMGPNETLHNLLEKAGGLTSNAFVYGTEFYREKVKQDQQSNLEKVIRRIEKQQSANLGKSAANQISLGADSAQISALKLKEEQQRNADELDRLRKLKATGRISFGLEQLNASKSQLPALKLENGDQLVIPSRPDFVHVYGAVNQEASMIWKDGMTIQHLIAQVGPTIDADLEELFVIRANGTVVSSNSRSWFSSLNSMALFPGDAVVVPEKLDKESTYKKVTNSLKDWAQILSGFGLGAAAFKSLK